MVSSRCKGNNLLNHIKQKNIEHSISYDVCRDRYSVNYLKWIATFEIQGNKFTGVGRNKLQAIDRVLDESEDVIYNIINVRV